MAYGCRYKRVIIASKGKVNGLEADVFTSSSGGNCFRDVTNLMAVLDCCLRVSSVSQPCCLIIAETLLVSLQSPVTKHATQRCTISTWLFNC